MIKRIFLAIAICALSMLDSSARSGALPPEGIDWARGIIVTHGTCRVNINERGTPVNEDGTAVISLTRGEGERVPHGAGARP